MSDHQTYRTFLRSARNFEEFAKARKKTVRQGLSLSDARAMCEEYNRNRTEAEIRKGTKMEFTAE